MNMHFPIEKVKALKAYYKQCSAGMRGRGERSDYDNAAKLCEQLISLMEPAPARAGTPKKKEVAPSA